MVFLSRKRVADGKRKFSWTFEIGRQASLPVRANGRVACSTDEPATRGTHVCHDSRDGRLPLFRFQRDVTAAALAIDAQ